MTHFCAQLAPNCPDQAGLAIHQMAIAVLSPQAPHAAIHQLVSHLQLRGMRVDYTRVSAWCNGHFHGNRLMTIEQFQELVNIFWGRPGGIETTAEVLSLARCIGKLSCGQQAFELARQLNYVWLVSLGHKEPLRFENVHIPDYRYPDHPFTLPREQIIQRLTEMLNYAGVSNSPIVIFGQPATGKSCLISHLACSSWGQHFGKKRVIYLNGGGVESYLRFWHQEIYGFAAPLEMRVEDLAQALRYHEKVTRQIVLVDAVAHLRFIKPILEIFKNTSSVVILTPHAGRPIEGLRIEKRTVIHLPGFTLPEAMQLYEKGGERLNPVDLPAFKALHATLKGNPLALYYAFQNVENGDFGRLVRLLNCADTEIPTGMLKEIFFTLQVGYERLPPYLQKPFARLGAMKRFHLIDLETLAALWADSQDEINPDKAGLLVTQLQDHISPFEPVRGQEFRWRLHKQTHLFAKSKLEEADKGEQELAQQWFSRAVEAGNYSMPSTSLSQAAKSHLRERLKGDKLLPLNKDVLVRLAQLLIFGIDPGREVIEANIHRLTSYEYFVARSLDQEAFGRRKWFWLAQANLAALLALHTLFSNNRVARFVEGWLLLAFLTIYGRLCCELTKSTCLWSQLWKQVNERISKEESCEDG